MAALIEMVLEGQVDPHSLISWLDGLFVEGALEDLSPLRVEFVPVFLNFLRDQSSGVLQMGSSNGATPNKGSNSIRAIKYVSPGKDPFHKARARKHYSSSKAKTLRFCETPVKNKSPQSLDESHTSDIDQLLRETDSALTLSHKSPLVPCPPKNLYSSTPKGNNDKTSTHFRYGSASPKLTSPEFGPQERHFWGKRQNSDGDDRGGRGNFSSERKHSEQRLSLGDFLGTEPKWGSKKKSPLSRDNNVRTGNSGVQPVRQLSKALDISDENVFPMVGCVPNQEKQPKRRINPTRITPASVARSNKSTPFNLNPKSLFGFPQGQSQSTSFMTSEEGTKTLEEERKLLRQERLKRQEIAGKDSGVKSLGRESPPGQPLQKPFEKASDYVEASLDQVTNRTCLDILAQIYSELILCNMAPSIMVELYYVIQLLTIRVIVSSSDTEENSKADESYLGTLHNCVYFASSVLLKVMKLINLLDKTTIRLLSENPRIQHFSETLHRHLARLLNNPLPVPVLNQQPKSPIGGVSFQSDTDNRNNFSCDQAFHVFRKQRDMFYEIIRVWEENHLTPGWSYTQGLGSRIRHLLSMRADPTNFAHFARLFQSQLLTMCRGEDTQFNPHMDSDDLGFLTLLKIQHPEKYKRLHERLVTPSKLGGPCPAPSFPGSQEFFKDFIVTATHGTFNQHLKDVLISHILQLNEQEFIIAEPEEGDPVYSMVHMEARSVVLNLRILAKFLGFLEFLPYQTTNHLSENVLATQVELRSKVYPPINLNAALRQCASTGRLVVGITWMVEYLSMVDPVALHSKHYLTVVMTLIAVFKLLYIARNREDTGCPQCSTVIHSKNLSPINSLLLKLLLGWLFDLPMFPDGLFFADVTEADIDQFEYNQTIKVLNCNYNTFCMICLRKILSPTYDEEENIEPSGTEVPATTPSKNRIIKSKNISKTPLKHENQGSLLSPMKTPSKLLAVSMLETPETTPLKMTDSQDVTECVIWLDVSNFVDQQLITICCPFVCELKNLLSDFWLGVGSNKSTGTNSCRRITPLSASDKESSGKAQRQLQLQLEDNFFHNHPSSVRKTIEFIIERVSSNIIKKIRMTVIPQYRESVVDKLKGVIESQMQKSPPSSSSAECKKDILKKHAVELGQEMCSQLKNQCLQLSQQESHQEVKTVLVLLLPTDVTSQGVEICQKLVCRSSQEKVNAWTQSHITPALFSKDLTLDSERLFRQAQKNADYQAMTSHVSHEDTTHSNFDASDASVVGGENNSFLENQSSVSLSDFPFSPTNQPSLPRSASKKSNFLEGLPLTAQEHDFDVMAPSKILKLIKVMIHNLISSADNRLLEAEIAQNVQNLLQNIRQIITKRQDVTLTVFRALEVLTVDLAITIVTCVPAVMTPENQAIFISLWKPVTDGGLIPSPCGLVSFMCPRTVMLVAQNPSSSHQVAAWKKIEEFITLLFSAELLTPASLQEQCISLLRYSWPEDILTGLSLCIKGISENSRKQKHHIDDPTFTELLEWVGWVCGEMEEFPDL